MLATVPCVVATHDLAKGVLVGVLLSGIFFAGKVARLCRVDVGSCPKTADCAPTASTGQVFFASAEAFIAASTSATRRNGSSSTSASPFLGHLRRRARSTSGAEVPPRRAPR